MENAWKDRYYELERTLESIVRAVESEMRKQESRDTAQPFLLSKITRSKILVEEYMHCVASGTNLEYAFAFMSDGQILHSVPFQRSNSIPLRLCRENSATHCRISVRENSGQNAGAQIEREIVL